MQSTKNFVRLVLGPFVGLYAGFAGLNAGIAGGFIALILSDVLAAIASSTTNYDLLIISRAVFG